MKIAVLSPQGNGVTNGGITAFTNQLVKAGAISYFRKLNGDSTNNGLYPWEGKEYTTEMLESKEFLEEINSYDVIINNWPTWRKYEQHAYYDYKFWKKIKTLKVQVVHNPHFGEVFRENFTPLMYNESDVLLFPVGTTSNIVKEILEKMPWLKERVSSFNLIYDTNQKDFEISNVPFEKRIDQVVHLGMWKPFRDMKSFINWFDTTDLPKLNIMGVSNDTATYFNFFALLKDVVHKTNYELFEKSTCVNEGIVDLEKFSQISDQKIPVISRYHQHLGMQVVSNSLFCANMYGPWDKESKLTHGGGAKLETSSMEAMFYSVPIFDGWYIDNLEKEELKNSPHILKFYKPETNTPSECEEKNNVLREKIEKLRTDAKAYSEAREWCRNYIINEHSASNFLDKLKTLKKKTFSMPESECILKLYGKEVEITPDLYCSFKHTAKGEVYIIPEESMKPGEKIKPVVKKEIKQSTELF
jgi:hypothetical protein